ncbi:hypothetical protein SAMN05216503_0229 [Polaribacter sp. KT25b]|uniref:hypothetical protein n=1 Tax=Polaribacter sp. KT25b TaxID=1855336 RepID=UPI0008792AA3|nr:hypothetical protein [Polaribacter sp. KT25b]SDR67013.1 hypothetical protein SAMN05216503_0229 [Polaribacter sp. KT25b]
MPNKAVYIEELRKRVISKTKEIGGFNKDENVFFVTPANLLIKLEEYDYDCSKGIKESYKILESNIKKCFKSINYKAVFEFAELIDKETKEKIKKTDLIIDSCIISSDTFQRFNKINGTKGLDNKTFDYFSFYLGYAGWGGFQNNITIADCFMLDMDSPNIKLIFSKFDINGYKESLKSKEKINYNKREQSDFLDIEDVEIKPPKIGDVLAAQMEEEDEEEKNTASIYMKIYEKSFLNETEKLRVAFKENLSKGNDPFF